jgi:uncharacterized metal-binding protein YceD (DUF177 family)
VCRPTEFPPYELPDLDKVPRHARAFDFVGFHDAREATRLVGIALRDERLAPMPESVFVTQYPAGVRITVRGTTPLDCERCGEPLEDVLSPCRCRGDDR